MKFDLVQLSKRIKQSTSSLMDEVGGVIECSSVRRNKFHGVGVMARNYALRRDNNKVLAVAHCDSVDHDSDHFCTDPESDVVFSSRLDDRLGVFIIMDVLPSLGINTDILLTDCEECGWTTAEDAAKDIGTDHPYNWMFQFDRHGPGAVTYQYTGMRKYLRPYFDNIEHGSFSDICKMDGLGICGVNVGTAYYNEHTAGSYALLNILSDQIERFVRLYEDGREVRIPHSKPVYRPLARKYVRATKDDVRKAVAKLSPEILEAVKHGDMLNKELDCLTEDQWQAVITLLDAKRGVDISRSTDRNLLTNEGTLRAWRDDELTQVPLDA